MTYILVFKHENTHYFISRQAGRLLNDLEQSGGLHWNNLWSRIKSDDPQTMGLYWLMFLVDIGLYAFIMWYVDNVKPGTYGVGRKWYFPFEVKITFRMIYQTNLKTIKTLTLYEQYILYVCLVMHPKIWLIG